MLPAVDHLPLRTQYRFAQVLSGVELEGYGVVMVTDAKGLRSITGALVASPHLANREVLTAEEAVTVAGGKAARLVGRVKGSEVRRAWEVEVHPGPMRVWVDAENGRILDQQAAFWSVEGRGYTWEPDPAGDLEEWSFEVDPGDTSEWLLQREGRLRVEGADGSVLSVASNPDFRLPSSDPRFPEVSLYSQLWSDQAAYSRWGATLPEVVARMGAACADGSVACAGEDLRFGEKLGSAALDATVVSHELAHLLVAQQVEGAGGEVSEVVAEGVADYLACIRHHTDTIGAWLGEEDAGETGGLPRQIGEEDVFPGHLRFGNDPHATGQILAHALRRAQAGTALRGADLEPLLVDALGRSGLGLRFPGTERGYRAMQGVLLQLLQSAGPMPEAVALVQAFAEVGIFSSAQEAVMVPPSTLLDPAVPPTFRIYTGEAFSFQNGEVVPKAPLNRAFVVELASDPEFQVNDWVSEALGGVTVDEQGIASARWTVPEEVWAQLREQPQLYYRVTTWADTGGSVRSSTHYGGEAMRLPVAEVSIAQVSSGCSHAGTPSVGWLGMALLWLRRRLRRA